MTGADTHPLPETFGEADGERLTGLTTVFLDLASKGPLSDTTLEYVHAGGNLRLCLAEISALSPPSELELAASQAREDYLAVALQRPRLRQREAHRVKLEQAEVHYVDRVLGRIESVVDANTPEQVLAVRQMPTIVEKTAFADGQARTLADLMDPLYVLMDTAICEHVQRREIIDGKSRRSLAARVLGNRIVRASVALAVFTVSVSPKFGLVPAGNEHLAEQAEIGLQVLSGAILGLETPEIARSSYLMLKHGRRTKQLHDQMAADATLSDHALRLTYNSTRYNMAGRTGTDDFETNLRRFAELDAEFQHLNNDPGGKPYSGEQALGYAARFLIERSDQLAEIIAAATGVRQRELYLALARGIILEDLKRMKKGLAESRVRRVATNIAIFIPSMVFSPVTSEINEAATLGRDTAKTMKTKPQD